MKQLQHILMPMQYSQHPKEHITFKIKPDNFPPKQLTNPLSNTQHKMSQISIKDTSCRDTIPREAASYIISLMKDFPNSFYTTGSMSGYYTIQVDPNVKSVQHT